MAPEIWKIQNHNPPMELPEEGLPYYLQLYPRESIFRTGVSISQRFGYSFGRAAREAGMCVFFLFVSLVYSVLPQPYYM